MRKQDNVIHFSHFVKEAENYLHAKASESVKIVKNCQVLSDMVFHATYCQNGRFSGPFDIRGYISLKAGSRLSRASWGHLQAFKPPTMPKNRSRGVVFRQEPSIMVYRI